MGEEERSCQRNHFTLRFLDTCHADGVDVVGCDMNQGVAHKTHVTSLLFEAMREFCHNTRSPLIFRMSPSTVKRCMIAVASTSCQPARSLQNALFSNMAGCPFRSADIGLRRTDGDAHYPDYMWPQRALRNDHPFDGWAHSG